MRLFSSDIFEDLERFRLQIFVQKQTRAVKTAAQAIAAKNLLQGGRVRLQVEFGMNVLATNKAMFGVPVFFMTRLLGDYCVALFQEKQAQMNPR